MKGVRSCIASAFALACLIGGPPAYGQADQPEPDATITIAPDRPAEEINPAGRPIILTVPVMDGGRYMGDATVTLDADGRVDFSADRLIALLEPGLEDSLLETLRTRLGERRELSPEDLEAVGIAIRYDPQMLQIELEIAAASRAASVIGLGSDSARTVTYMEPARFSAYLNLRGAVDWVQQGQDDGLAPPVTFIDGAARLDDIVLESELNWQPGAAGVDLQRRGSRLVHDDREALVRWSAGDLISIARGFQSAPEIAGLSASRRYSTLQPQTIIRPRGTRSFQLERRSMVEVRINDRLVRRIELEPGAYDLQDFPFTQGANDVELTITDDTGRTERVDFNIFLDQAQLAEGLSEFGFYAGVLAPLGQRGPAYSDDPAFSGFYRRGISERLTLGANLQADSHGWMGGGEVMMATPIGAVAAFASASQVEDAGTGWATLVTFQRSFTGGGSGAHAFSLSAEARSRQFAPIGIRRPDNPYSLTIGASYNGTITDAIYGGIDARYSRGRDDEPDVRSIRGTLGWSLAPNLSFTGDVTYERDRRGNNFGALLSLTYRFDRRSSLRADYDSRYDRARLSYQTYGGSGVGAYSIGADLEHSDIGAGASVNTNYYGNRAELGFSHFGIFEKDLGGSTAQRSTLRFGTALAIADGTMTVGRPVHDAFALVATHSSLNDHEILVDPAGESASATTGALGTALQPSLSSYSDRSISVAAPEAPIDIDLGAGSFRLLPPYRGGYLLKVGSDYNVTAVGRLLTESGEPLSLVAGTASELADPEREPVALFTNRDGRFGVTGLAPGRWRIAMTDGAIYEIEIDEEMTTIRLGDVRPAEQPSDNGANGIAPD